MPLLENGRVVADNWVRAGDTDALPDSSPAILGFERLRRDADGLAARNAPLGALLSPDTKPEDVEPFLNRLALIAVDFPKFRDGRGFTIARALRERYGYEGEIRAVGHVLPDQYVYLLRTGFTTVEIPEGAKAEHWEKALTFYHTAYQPAVTADAPLAGLHRHLAVRSHSKAV